MIIHEEVVNPTVFGRVDYIFNILDKLGHLLVNGSLDSLYFVINVGERMRLRMVIC